MKMIEELLFEHRDAEYAAFQARLTPSVDRELFIGVRVPEVRKLAKQLKDETAASDFIRELPHKYYDENILHALLISEIRDYEKAVRETDRFLPYVDNWAVCDIMSPKVFKKHKTQLLRKIREWTDSGETYTVRFGIEMLMSHYLDEDFRPEYLEIPGGIRSDEYYVNMMIAWFFATALAKQWDAAIPFLEQRRLDERVHKKTIRKAKESYRITDEQKSYLKMLNHGKKELAFPAAIGNNVRVGGGGKDGKAY